MSETLNKSVLEEKGVAELKTIAKSLDLKVNGLKKAEIIEKIAGNKPSSGGGNGSSKRESASAVTSPEPGSTQERKRETAPPLEGAAPSESTGVRDENAHDDRDRRDDPRNNNRNRNQNQGGNRNRPREKADGPGGGQGRRRRRRRGGGQGPGPGSGNVAPQRYQDYDDAEVEDDPNAEVRTGILDLLPEGYGFLTTASYEARQVRDLLRHAGRARAPAVPRRVFLPPDFELYRERSNDVMAVLRAQVERVEVVGLDEAYLDLTGSTAPGGRAAGEGGGDRGDGPRLLDRDRAEQARREGGLRCRQAGRVPRADPRGGVRALRRDLPRPDPRDRPEDRRRLEQRGIQTLARWPDTRTTLAAVVRRQPRPPPRPARALRGRPAARACGSPSRSPRETTFDRDLLGLEALEPVLDGWRHGLCEGLQRQDAAGRTIGIKVRYDDFSTVTRAKTIERR